MFCSLLWALRLGSLAGLRIWQQGERSAVRLSSRYSQELELACLLLWLFVLFSFGVFVFVWYFVKDLQLFFVRSCREQVMTENLALERNPMISSYWHWAMKLMWNWCWNLWVVNSIFSTPFSESPHSVSWTKYLTPICEMQSLSNEDLFHCVSEWKSDWKICLGKNLTAKLVQLIQCLQLWKQEDN